MARMKYEFRVVFDVDADPNAEDWEVYKDIDTVGKYMYHVLIDEYPGMEGRIKVYPSRSSVEFPGAYQRPYDFDPSYFDRDVTDEPEDFIPPTFVKAEPSPPTQVKEQSAPKPKPKMTEVKVPQPVRRPEPEPVHEEEQGEHDVDEYEDFQPYQADETALEQEYENLLRQQRGEAPRPIQPARPQGPAMIQYGDPPGEEYNYEEDSQADWPSPGMPGRYR